MSPRVAPETGGVPPGGDASLTEERDVTVAGLTFADDAAPEDCANLTDLWGQRCPNCTSGVLLVTRYDPEALHEAGQGAAIASAEPTGGAYEVHCFNCAFHESRILPRNIEDEDGE